MHQTAFWRGAGVFKNESNLILLLCAQVSLAGKNKSRTQETKQDFVERTRREREARETQRRREKAALDVQVSVPPCLPSF